MKKPEKQLAQDSSAQQPLTEERKQAIHKRFLERLGVFHYNPSHPVRTWMSVLGIILFIALVIAYYLTNGGGG